MKILFISPVKKTKLHTISSYIPLHFPSKIYFYNTALTFPILAAITPKNHTIEMVEGDIKDITFNKKYDLVGITTLTHFAQDAYEIADKFRKTGVKVVLGGYHASALPQEAKQHADAVVVGEAEEIWPQLLKDVENGKLKDFYTNQKFIDSSQFPHPKTDIIPKRLGVGVMATRGCPNGCEYCSITNMINRNRFRKRQIDDAIKDVKDLKNKSFFLFDNSISANPKYYIEFFKKMKGFNKKFIGYGNINVLGNNEELLKRASEAGCTSLMIGFESINQETLDSIHKRVNKVENYITSIKKIHDYKIIILGLFVFGFDTDTLDIFRQTDEFVRKSGIDAPFFHTLSPEPGTPIFKQLDSEGRILTRDWSKYSSANHVVFQPKNMTPEKLLYNTMRLNKKTYTTSRVFERIMRNRKMGHYAFFETAWINFFVKSLVGFAPGKYPDMGKIGI